MTKHVTMDKYTLLQTILSSNLSPQNKTLLCTLVIYHNERYGAAWPSVEWLCKVRGVSHERNFEGVGNYLPGLVEVQRRGRLGNKYTLNFPAIEALPQNEVTLKHTPPPLGKTTGSHPAAAATTPGGAASTPSAAVTTPSTEGANSRRDTKEDREIGTLTNRTETEQEDDVSTSSLASTTPPSAAATSGTVHPSLVGEAPAPGGKQGEQERLLEDGEIVGGTRTRVTAPEGVTEAQRAALRRAVTIEREVYRRIRDDRLRREVLKRATDLDAGGFDGRIDDLIDAAVFDGEPW